MSFQLKILLIEWNSYCHEDMKSALQEMRYFVQSIPFPNGIRTEKTEAEELLSDELKRCCYDFVFSFNYFPVISEICQQAGIKYLSWVYDSPYIHVYSYTILNSCNYVFLFDYAVYEELKQAGIETVYYLPLAVNERRLAGFDRKTGKRSIDISFVGSLYTEPKHRIYDKFQGINDYSQGYLEAIVQAQKRVYGYNFLKELLTPDILAQLQKAYPTDPNALTVMSPEAIYADFVFNRRVTALERQEILTILGKRYKVHLYTNDRMVQIKGVKNHGPADYYKEMPAVFQSSKINLNITLRSIKTGIPLRAIDIMGSGGFLMTNYQSELLEYFEPDVDFVYYNDYEDLQNKTDYYLTHEKEREEIAANGCQKVRGEHTYQNRIKEMITTAGFLSS